MSVNKWVLGVCAGMAAYGSVSVLAQTLPDVAIAASAVQIPTTAASGLTLTYANGSYNWTAFTEGFYFCNDVPPGGYAHVLTLKHEDQTFSTAHPWSFPPVSVSTFGYTNGVLKFSAFEAQNLECVSTAIDGSAGSGLADGIFENSYESRTSENFSHLVNWVPPRTFDWSNPNWAEVPVAACDPQSGETPSVVEDIGCATATGVSSNTASGAVRAPTMWTSTDGINFTYLFRVDTRFGPQAPGAQPVMSVPPMSNGVAPAGSSTMTLLIQDAYEGGDANHIGYLSDTGSWCVIYQLPTTLNSSTCAQSGSLSLTGPMTQTFPIGNPPFGTGADQAFYVVINRLVQGGHPSLVTPVVAAAVLIEPAVALEGGDKFSGDNVVFGFMPSSTGFPWMGGQ